jgi:hypothetical protein
MYSRTWFQFENRVLSFAVAEVGSGNMYTGSPDVKCYENFLSMEVILS